MNIVSFTVVFSKSNVTAVRNPPYTDNIVKSDPPLACAQIKLTQDMFVNNGIYENILSSSESYIDTTYDIDNSDSDSDYDDYGQKYPRVKFLYARYEKQKWFVMDSAMKKSVEVYCRFGISGCKCTEAKWCRDILRDIENGDVYDIIFR